MVTSTETRKARRATTHANQVVLPRVQRQHRIIEELRVRAVPTTARQLAISIGVGQRTVERDVAELVDAGLPIVASRGRYGGYRLVAGPRLGTVDFTVAEAAAIAVALAAVGPYSSACNQSALGKVLAALNGD